MVFKKKANVVKYRRFKCIGLLIFCIICLLSLSICSNADAITYTQNLTYVQSLSASQWYCGMRKSTDSSILDVPTAGGSCSIGGFDNLNDQTTASRFLDYFKTVNTYSVSKDYIYELKFIVRSSTLTTSPISLLWGITNSAVSPNFRIKSIDVVEVGQATQTVAVTNTYQTPGGSMATDSVVMDLYPQQEFIYSIYFQPSVDADDAVIQVGRAGYHMFRFPPSATVQPVPTVEFYILPSIDVYSPISSEDEAAEKEMESTENIENQSTSDMPNSSDNQSTSLVGAISSFVSAFQNIQPSANCNLTLPFPEFLGGNTTVNICQGKDKAPTLIAAGSSLLLIVTFVPLAFIMLRMIYNEIRSFTNG